MKLRHFETYFITVLCRIFFLQSEWVWKQWLLYFVFLKFALSFSSSYTRFTFSISISINVTRGKTCLHLLLLNGLVASPNLVIVTLGARHLKGYRITWISTYFCHILVYTISLTIPVSDNHIFYTHVPVVFIVYNWNGKCFEIWEK